MPNPSPTPAESFASFFRSLTLKVAERSMWGPLSSALALFIQLRLHHIKRRVREVIESLAAGTYVPRRAGQRRRSVATPIPRKPRAPSPVALKFGWLEPLLPDLPPFRSQVLHMLQDPQMVAAIQAAPTALGRPLRSLCWMLRLKPPPALARPQPAPQPPPPVAQAALREDPPPLLSPARATPAIGRRAPVRAIRPKMA